MEEHLKVFDVILGKINGAFIIWKRYVTFLGNHGVLLGDSGYPLRRYLMVPFVRSASLSEDRYNSTLCKTCSKVDCTLGILQNHFGYILQKLRVHGPQYSCQIITACLVLHNICIGNHDFFEPLEEAGLATHRRYVDTYFS